jgi:hypothetical protein
MKIFPVGERVATVNFPLISLAPGLRPKGLGGPWEHGEVGGRCPGDCSQIDHHRLGSGWHHSEAITRRDVLGGIIHEYDRAA